MPLLVLVAVAGWIGVRGLLAKSTLEQAQVLVAQLKSDAASMNLAALDPLYAELADKTQEARQLTGDPIWRVAEFVPVLGRNLTVVRELAEATDDVVVAVGPLVDLAADLDPAALAPKDGAIPLDPFVRAVPLVEAAAADLKAIDERTQAIDAEGTISQVANAREKFVELLGSARPALDTASDLVPLLPALLGADGPRTYVVMFENNAEARSLGGTALSFALISIDGGKIELKESVPAGFGNFPPGGSTVAVPEGFDQIYPGAFGYFIANATLRPSLPSAGAIVHDNWLRSRGIDADGVFAIDAVALSYLLRATGPVSLSTGDVIDANNSVSFLLNEVLRRFQTGDIGADNLLQDRVYSETVTQTFGKLSGGQFDVPTMALSVVQAFGERRMGFWSSLPEEQERLVAAGIDNDLPQSDGVTDHIGFYINDHVGSKLNFYLKATLATSSAVCTADGRQAHRLVVGLYNLLQPADVRGVGPSILGSYAVEGLDPGVQRLMLFGYAPPGSTILSASVDGIPIELDAFQDSGYPVAKMIVSVQPGSSAVIVLDILMGEPGDRELEVQTTPLVNPLEYGAVDAALDCSTVALPAS